MKKLIFFIYLFCLALGGCKLTQSPAQKYANEHSYREFTSWKEIGKKWDKIEKSKPKEHAKKNKW